MLGELAARTGDPGGRRTFARAVGGRSWRRGCRGSRWSTRPGWPGSPTISATWRRRSGRLRAALEHGGAYLEPTGQAQLHLQLAEILGGSGTRSTEAAEHALEAAHWADEAGEGADARAPGRGTSSAVSCCGRAGGRRPPRCWSRRCPI